MVPTRFVPPFGRSGSSCHGRFEIDRIYDGGEEIVALGRLSRLMPEGDARIEDRGLASWTIRDGKVVRLEVLGFGKAEVDKALQAAGLSE